ncbi:RNA polymerase sigma factor [Burkholderia contaminans]|uniref:ECF subfamily RNA polymerase sigma-24 factor n=2 Tax=Burkholderia cepacia complex TaxID=87882 RepID=A0A6J5J5G6_9BURK|nr:MULTISPECIES: RNA polymerase sigma factor [Burkholderia]MBN3733343.1 RNA polymerase sigma factor [Burkholderia sp. Tr-20390]MBN3748954.1 RNA polymerase sigma factor [Burkholderia sp. Se-20373]OXI92317.1 RNA polymerase subunit sigma [Burkholderia sp. AU33803]OXJ07950.1 RNA polymerase subunit sigma [Burkholderia sp. AU6039]PRD86806.1 RNA polymerase sigma factor [Burkholderia contaminans]
MASFIDDLLRGYADLRRVLTRELSADDAADIAQSSFEQVLRYAGQRPVESPAGLLFAISRNQQIDSARRRKRVPHQSLDDVDGLVDQLPVSELTPERRYAARQRMEILGKALDALPPRCREAFVLCKLHGLSYDETAQEMGISTTVVRKYLVQAMKECRIALL